MIRSESNWNWKDPNVQRIKRSFSWWSSFECMSTSGMKSDDVSHAILKQFIYLWRKVANSRKSETKMHFYTWMYFNDGYVSRIRSTASFYIVSGWWTCSICIAYIECIGLNDNFVLGGPFWRGWNSSRLFLFSLYIDVEVWYFDCLLYHSAGSLLTIQLQYMRNPPNDVRAYSPLSYAIENLEWHPLSTALLQSL